MAKSWIDDHNDEILTNNAALDTCEQCEDCRFWGNNPSDFTSNKFDKSNCDMFPSPGMKPIGVINNTDICPLWEAR